MAQGWVQAWAAELAPGSVEAWAAVLAQGWVQGWAEESVLVLVGSTKNRKNKFIIYNSRLKIQLTLKGSFSSKGKGGICMHVCQGVESERVLKRKRKNKKYKI